MDLQYSFCISKTRVLDNRSNFYSVAKTMLYCVTLVVGREHLVFNSAGGIKEYAETVTLI
jgi:hypothetical protein